MRLFFLELAKLMQSYLETEPKPHSGDSMKLPLIVSLLCVVSVSVNAQTTYKTKKRLPSQATSESDLDSYESQPKKSDKSIELSLGYISGKVKDSESSNDANGISLRAGKTFTLAQEFKTTTSLVVNSSKLDFPNDIDIKEETHMTDFGISQRFSYDMGTPSGAFFRPFIEAGIGMGALKSEMTVEGINMKANIDYSKVSGAVGMQLVMENGITPYVLYQVSKIKMDDKIEVEALGQKVSEELDGDRKLTNKSLQIGIGILF